MVAKVGCRALKMNSIISRKWCIYYKANNHIVSKELKYNDDWEVLLVLLNWRLEENIDTGSGPSWNRRSQ